MSRRTRRTRGFTQPGSPRGVVFSQPQCQQTARALRRYEPQPSDFRARQSCRPDQKPIFCSRMRSVRSFNPLRAAARCPQPWVRGRALFSAVPMASPTTPSPSVCSRPKPLWASRARGSSSVASLVAAETGISRTSAARYFQLVGLGSPIIVHQRPTARPAHRPLRRRIQRQLQALQVDDGHACGG